MVRGVVGQGAVFLALLQLGPGLSLAPHGLPLVLSPEHGSVVQDDAAEPLGAILLNRARLELGDAHQIDLFPEAPRLRSQSHSHYLLHAQSKESQGIWAAAMTTNVHVGHCAAGNMGPGCSAGLGGNTAQSELTRQKSRESQEGRLALIRKILWRASRSVLLYIENRSGDQLQLCTARLEAGNWRVIPPPIIPAFTAVGDTRQLVQSCVQCFIFATCILFAVSGVRGCRVCPRHGGCANTDHIRHGQQSWLYSVL